MVVPSSPKATFKIDEWGAGSPDKVPQTRLNNVQGQKQPDGAFCCSLPPLPLYFVSISPLVKLLPIFIGFRQEGIE
ncbi:hypothetical protein FOXYSP1_07794 [Fusarium oxysporum f. sp. phaseoli]